MEDTTQAPQHETEQSALHWMQRTKILLGEEKIKKLINSNVLIVGLGGVGGIAAEMIARAGVGKITIVDNDDIDTTNRNRQIPALSSTVGKQKATVLAERLKDINPNLDLTVIQQFISDGKAREVLAAQKYDYCLDCIDTLSSKCWFIRSCIEAGVPVATSMGAGGKVNPGLIVVSDISESKICRFAQAVRKRLHKWNIKTGIPVVYSTEIIDKSKLISTPTGLKKNIIGTISYMPAIFGCTLASVVIRDLYDGKQGTVKLEESFTKSQLKRMKKKNREKGKKGGKTEGKKGETGRVQPVWFIFVVALRKVRENKQLIFLFVAMSFVAWLFLKKK